MAELDAVKVAHADEVETLRNDVLDSIKKKEDVARKKGDIDLLDSLIVEREAFEKFGMTPESVSTARYATAMKKTRARMETAYTAAVKDLANANEDERMWEVRQEWKAFQEQEGAALGIMPGAVWEGLTTWTRSRTVANGGTVKAGYQHKSRLSISSVNGREFKGEWSWGDKPDREPVDKSKPIIGKFENGRVEWKGDGNEIVVACFGVVKGRTMQRTSDDAVSTLFLKTLK